MAKRSTAASTESQPEKKKKRSFWRRLFRPVEVGLELATVLVTEPRSFPHVFSVVFRRGFRTVWNARGGGLYAVGFFLTFLWLELTMFVDDVAEASGVGDFITGQLFELILRFTFESLLNTLLAFLWPVYVMQYEPPIGLVFLGVAYLLFPRFVKPTLERWLFKKDTGAGLPTENAHENTDTASND